MNNKIIGLDEIFCQKSFLINRLKKYHDECIIGDYINKKDLCEILLLNFHKCIIYNGESTKSNIKYKRPFVLFEKSISYKRGGVFFYPYIAEFFLSFKGNLIQYRKKNISVNKSESICFISSNKGKIEKAKYCIEALGDVTLYGKYSLKTMQSNELDEYASVHDSAIRTHNLHKCSLVMENQIDNGYITEKVLLSLYGESVPIYFGTNIANIISSDYYVDYEEYISISSKDRFYLVNHKLENIKKSHDFFTNEFKRYLEFLEFDFLCKFNFHESVKISQNFRKILVI